MKPIELLDELFSPQTRVLGSSVSEDFVMLGCGDSVPAFDRWTDGQLANTGLCIASYIINCAEIGKVAQNLRLTVILLSPPENCAKEGKPVQNFLGKIAKNLGKLCIKVHRFNISNEHFVCSRRRRISVRNVVLPYLTMANGIVSCQPHRFFVRQGPRGPFVG